MCRPYYWSRKEHLSICYFERMLELRVTPTNEYVGGALLPVCHRV
jgi:hypothetical protein